MLLETLASFHDAPGAPPGKWAPTRFWMDGEVDVQRVRLAGVAVACSAGSAQHGPWTLW